MGIQYNYIKSDLNYLTDFCGFCIPVVGMESLMAQAAAETLLPHVECEDSALDRIRLVEEDIQGYKTFHAYRLAHSEMEEQYLGLVAFDDKKEPVIFLASPAEEAERLAG